MSLPEGIPALYQDESPMFNPQDEEYNRRFLTEVVVRSKKIWNETKLLTELVTDAQTPVTMVIANQLGPFLHGNLSVAATLSSMANIYGQMLKDYDKVATIASREDLKNYFIGLGIEKEQPPSHPEADFF